MTSLRALNEAGIARFRSWLETNAGDPPSSILRDPLYCRDLEHEFSVDVTRRHATSFELGKYLADEVLVGNFDRVRLAQDNGLWAWLSLAYLDDLLIRRGPRKGKPLDAAHYVETSKRLGYRLIARTAWQLVAAHGQNARVALASPKSPWGEMAEQMTSRLEIFTNPAVWPIACELYLSPDGSLKRGSTSQRPSAARRDPSNQAGLGGIRRLPNTIRQFERTFHLRAMPPTEVIRLLPDEYRRWDGRPSE